MKKIIIFAFLILNMAYSFAQVPKTFNYQAVARNDKGTAIANQNIVVEISVRQGSTSGTIVWQEVHYTQTNAFGLFTVEIGGTDGIRTEEGSLSSFDKIDWAIGSYYIQTRVDFGKSEFVNGFIDMGTVKLTSVPYALVSDSALKVPIPTLSQIVGIKESTLNNNDVPKWNGTTWTVGQAGVSGAFLTQDGSTDLTGDWTISSNNLTLTNGLLSTNSFLIGGTTFTATSTDLSTNSLPTALVTASAVKTYVDNNIGVSYWTLNAGKVYNTANNIGIGTNFPESKLHVALQNSESLLVTGTYNSAGNISNRGAGTRLEFFPIRASLRVGTVAGTQWDDSNVGQYSYAFGNNDIAKGDFSFVAGDSNTANGNYSVALGISNTANGSKSVVFGKSNKANGASSVALNESNTANGSYSIALGLNNTASGDASIAAGQNTLTDANANASFAMGNATQTYGLYSMAIGDASIANTSAEASFAAGYGAITYGKYSSAFGDNTAASSYAEFAIGRYNTIKTSNLVAWDLSDRLFVIGIGVDASNRADAMFVSKNGDVTMNKNLTVNGTFSNPSDIRLKKDIVPLDSALEKIDKIKSVYYHWRKDEFPDRLFTNKKQIGFIAQDVEKVLPEVVQTDTKGYKSLDYAKMTVLLLEAIKEQQKQIDELKAKLK